MGTKQQVHKPAREMDVQPTKKERWGWKKDREGVKKKQDKHELSPNQKLKKTTNQTHTHTHNPKNSIRLHIHLESRLFFKALIKHYVCGKVAGTYRWLSRGNWFVANGKGKPIMNSQERCHTEHTLWTARHLGLYMHVKQNETREGEKTRPLHLSIP